jgi:hypothetical protein
MAAGADLPRSSPPPGSQEHREFAKALFGQNAQTVAAARLQPSPQTRQAGR